MLPANVLHEINILRLFGEGPLEKKKLLKKTQKHKKKSILRLFGEDPLKKSKQLLEETKNIYIYILKFLAYLPHTQDLSKIVLFFFEVLWHRTFGFFVFSRFFWHSYDFTCPCNVCTAVRLQCCHFCSD